MKIVVTSNGTTLNAPLSPVFGRCPVYIFLDTESMEYQAVENPAMGAPGGAGIQAAQFVVGQGAQAVLTGNVGPNAMNVLQAANVAVYLAGQATVQEAVEAFQQDTLTQTRGASVADHTGLARTQSRYEQTKPQNREAEIAELRKQAATLRKQLVELLQRIEALEKEA